MSVTRVAVVSGSNKGIGFGIVRGLCKNFSGDVFLTARNVGRGEAAVADLEKEGLKPKFHQLDITDHASIVKLADFLSSTYGGLDLLVNNAGVAYKCAATEPFTEQAEVSMKVNFLATLDVCNVLFPLLRTHARVVNVSSISSLSALHALNAEKKKQVLSAKTIEDVHKFMNEFVADTKAGVHKERGWPSSAYGMSKVAVTSMSHIHYKDLDAKGCDIVVNACCPGYVATDMSSFKGHLTIDQGAETPLYLALLPPDSASPRGEFVSQKNIVEWE